MMLLAFKVEVARDWLPLLLQGIGVLITLLAVGVALFGPSLRDRRRRPQLKLGYEFDHAESMICLTVENKAGKDTAEDVEIYVLEVHHPPWNAPPTPNAASKYNPAIQRPLQWHDPQARPTQQTVPTGFQRRCKFIYCDPEAARENPELWLQLSPMKQRIDFLWTGTLQLREHLKDFWWRPGEVDQPARLRVAVAGKDLDTMHYNVLVTYLPIKRGYQQFLDYTFKVRIEEAPPQLTREGRLHRTRRERVESIQSILRSWPEPNRSVIQRYFDRRRAGERPDLSQSGIRRGIKRWRGW